MFYGLSKWKILVLFCISVLVSVCLWGLLVQWLECRSCGGTFVRTLFWFECLR